MTAREADTEFVLGRLPTLPPLGTVDPHQAVVADRALVDSFFDRFRDHRPCSAAGPGHVLDTWNYRTTSKKS